MLFIVYNTSFVNPCEVEHWQKAKIKEKEMEVKMEESGGGSETNENKVILLTIKNVIYPINTDIIYRVASRHGFVERIVIFKKKFQQVSFNLFPTQ